MNFTNTLFRCSSLGHLMTDPRNAADKAAGKLSESAKTHLVDIYVSKLYNRQSDIQNRYIQKGLMVEEDSITLYSRLKKKYFKKNVEHLSNSFIQGTPDTYEGESIHNAEVIIDAKSSWDIFTFFRNHTKDIESIYYWQLQGYMALTGAKIARLAYCLIDTPEVLIQDEMRKLMYKMNAGTELNEDYIEACAELRRLMTYADIPMSERMIEFEIERSDEDIDRMYRRVIRARYFLRELYENLHPDEVNSLPQFHNPPVPPPQQIPLIKL